MVFTRTYRVVHGFTRNEQLAESKGSGIPSGLLRDMLYVRSLERDLGRKLSDEEQDGQPFMVNTRGVYEIYCVPLLKFPWDLLVYAKDVQVAMIKAPKNKLIHSSAEETWVKTAKRPPEYVSIWDRDETVQLQVAD